MKTGFYSKRVLNEVRRIPTRLPDLPRSSDDLHCFPKSNRIPPASHERGGIRAVLCNESLKKHKSVSDPGLTRGQTGPDSALRPGQKVLLKLSTRRYVLMHELGDAIVSIATARSQGRGRRRNKTLTLADFLFLFLCVLLNLKAKRVS